MSSSKLLARIICAALACSFLSQSSCARPVKMWSYDELFAEADLVVIAEPRTVQRTAESLPRHAGLLVGLTTSFAPKYVVKGTPRERQIRLIHYELKDTDAIIINAPMLVSFEIDERVIAVEYLLFLKVRPDDRYEPVSGQIDPIMSVRKLSIPEAA